MDASDIDWENLSPSELRELIGSFDPRPVFAQLEKMVVPHIQSQPKLFTLLPYDPLLELHDLSRVSYEPQPSSLGEVRALAAVATPNRERLISRALWARPDQISELYNRVQDGEAITILMAHEDITDIGRIMPEVLIVLCEHHANLTLGESMAGTAKWDEVCEHIYQELVVRFHIILSGIIRCVNALGYTVCSLLQKIGWLHFSFPQSDSTWEADFDPVLVKATNRLMRHELEQHLRTNGGVLGIAGPGSVDKRIAVAGIAGILQHMPRDFSDRLGVVRHIQPIYGGTASLLVGKYVLPVAAKIHGHKAFVQTGRLERVEDLDNLHKIMHWIAEVSFSRTLEPTIYHSEPGPLRALTAAIRRTRKE